MGKSALNIATYIVEYCDKFQGGISNIRLQPLLYFTQAQFIIRLNKVAFSEDIIASEYGPVVDSVHKHFKIYGRDNIILNVRPDIEKYLFKYDISDYMTPSTQDKEVINEVLNMTEDIATAELLRLSMWQRPYNEALRTNGVITKESIYDYFVGDCEQG